MTAEFRHLEDDTLALGRANSVIMELARNHCQNMIFSKENSGGGYVEALSGLPIDRRHVSCPVATSRTSGMNLDVLARDFYAEHCVGCSSRRPTGEVPNLASVIEADAAAHRAAAERVRDSLNRQQQAWESRAEQRRASRVGRLRRVVG